ncbi:Adenylate-forming reductase like protein [Verticillium longisporum]|nr:Adenylate-forming reductase like protein [Verticillium longisporum]
MVSVLSILTSSSWLVYKVVDIVVHRASQHGAVIATGIITSILVIISILSAFPWVRNNHHNTFERHHRFIGWLGLAATWCFTILGNVYDIKRGEWRSDAHSLLSSQELWFAVFMTVFIAIPWITLREVPVEVEIPSPKVAILKFERGMQQGLLGRISRTSIMEYHANHHNTFERHHRFIGWLGLAATWCFTILGNVYDIKRGEWRSDAHSLLSAQELWFAVFMTVFIAIPWITLREVPVEVEIPSPKVAILKFKRGMQQGLLGRISRTSIMEYHAFGIISEGRKSGCHYMICGVQGDFTKGLVADPPKTVWTRELKFAGVGHASAMFKRGIRICTGTGIGAALSTCIQSPNWFFIWIGSDQEKTFGPTISGLIHKHIEPDRMILWDSKKRGGRPDTLQLLQDVYKSFGAEVIFITSNKQGNDEMMQGCLAKYLGMILLKA